MSVGVPPRTSAARAVRTRRSVELASDGLPIPRIAGATSLANTSTAAALAMGLGVFAAAPLRGRTDEIIAGAFIIAVAMALGLRVARTAPRDRAIPVIAALGWVTQVASSLVYYYTDTAADAAAYHNLATRYATGQQQLIWPEANWGVEGIAATLSLLYRVTGPSMLLGFVAFGAMGLIGKLLVARALIRSRDVLDRGGEVAAALLVILPSLNIWVSAISKESIAILGIGLVIGGLVRRGEPPNALMLALGLALIAVVRAHVALLLSAAVVGYLVLTIALPRRQGGGRILPLVSGGALLAASLVAAAAYLGTGTGIDELEARRIELSGVADQGGSNIASTPITSPLEVPGAVANVLLRPYPWETYNLTTRAQATENFFLILGLAWLIGQGRRRRLHPQTGAAALRVRAMRMFGVAYLSGFLFAFSITYNLGLISRQRAQMWLPAMILMATAFVRVRRGRPMSLRDPRATSAVPGFDRAQQRSRGPARRRAAHPPVDRRNLRPR